METSMKCSVRRQYGALVEGLQVMESFLAEGRAARNQHHALGRCASRDAASRDGGNYSTTNSEENENPKPEQLPSGSVSHSEKNADVLTNQEPEQADDQEREDKDLSEQDVKAEVVGHGEGYQRERRGQLVRSIPDFIRTRKPIKAHQEGLASQTGFPSNSQPETVGCSRLLLLNPDGRLFVPSAAQIQKEAQKTPLFHRRDLTGVGRLPMIAQEPEPEERAERESRGSRSSRRCSSVDVGQDRSRRHSAAGKSPPPHRVYPESPGGHHPKTASMLTVRSPVTSRNHDLVTFRMAPNGLVIQPLESPPGSSNTRASPLTTARSALTTRSSISTRSPTLTSRSGGNVPLRSPWRMNRERPMVKSAATALRQTESGAITKQSQGAGGVSDNVSVALDAVTRSNLPPSTDNVFMKRHGGGVDTLRSYLRIIPPGFQMPPGADGTTSKSRMENYVKLAKDKRIYVTFCQSVRRDVTAGRARLIDQSRCKSVGAEGSLRHYDVKTKRFVRIHPIKIP